MNSPHPDLSIASLNSPITPAPFKDDVSPICSPTLSQSSNHDLLNVSVQEANELSEPLFPGSPVTKGKGWEMIMSFSITNRLSSNGITNLLHLFNELCPAPNHLPPSFYLLNRYHKEHKNFKQATPILL